MPIAVRVVSEQAYAAWVEDAKKKFATRRQPPAAIASARGRARTDERSTGDKDREVEGQQGMD